MALESIAKSLPSFVSELILSAGILLLIILGLIKRIPSWLLTLVTFIIFVFSGLFLFLNWFSVAVPAKMFSGFLRNDDFSSYLKLLFDISGIFTVVMTWRRQKEQPHLSEYYAIMMAVVLGAHLLAMSMNLIMVFISLELISIGSYILAGVSFTKQGSEGSLKYFLFGSTASAVMLYGFSFLYGFTGTLDFSSSAFVEGILGNHSTLFFIVSLMALAGFFYKIAAAPLHLWAPDVYEAAPIPVIAFFFGCSQACRNCNPNQVYTRSQCIRPIDI